MKNLIPKTVKEYLNERKKEIDFESTKESIKIGIKATILISIIPGILTTKFFVSQNVGIREIKSGINIMIKNEKNNKKNIFENLPLKSKEFTPK